MESITACYRSSSEDEPFPAKGKQQELTTNRTSYGERRPKRFIAFASVAIIALSATCVHLAVRIRHMEPIFSDRVYSPVKYFESKYTNIVFTTGFGGERTAYQGPPTAERSALWDDLYSFGINRIPRASAVQLVNKTLSIPGEPGQYAILLNVYHQLHCLNMLRKRLYDTREYSPDHETMGIEHMEHCYDGLRQSLMCSADLTPLTWAWDEEARQAKQVARIMHTCKDFEAIKD